MKEGAEPETARRASLADVIHRRRRDIETRWLAQVLADIGARDLDPTELRDAIPDYLEALARELRTNGGPPTAEMTGNAAWAPVAQEHAVTRVRQGFDIEELVHEFILLRRVLSDVAKEDGLGGDDAVGLLADLVEAGVAKSVKAYVESRDYAARRAEAEHIGFVTHELKNPLTAAHLVAQKLRADIRLTDAQHEQFHLLMRNLERLRDLIDGVLLVERFEANQVMANPVVMPLREVLAPGIETARAVSMARGLEFRAECGLDTLVRVDPELTSSVLGNLLDNAIKYTDEGTVRVSCEVTAEVVAVHVHDNCPGLSEEELRTIFDPFRRGEHPKKPGAGLGLAIAKRAVQAQGGDIAAESPGQQGCHFWFTLPRVVR